MTDFTAEFKVHGTLVFTCTCKDAQEAYRVALAISKRLKEVVQWNIRGMPKVHNVS